MAHQEVPEEGQTGWLLPNKRWPHTSYSQAVLSSVAPTRPPVAWGTLRGRSAQGSPRPKQALGFPLCISFSSCPSFALVPSTLAGRPQTVLLAGRGHRPWSGQAATPLWRPARELRAQQSWVPREPPAEPGQAPPHLLCSPGLASLAPNTAAHASRLVEEMAGMGAEGAPSSPCRDNEASASQGQALWSPPLFLSVQDDRTLAHSPTPSVQPQCLSSG